MLVMPTVNVRIINDGEGDPGAALSLIWHIFLVSGICGYMSYQIINRINNFKLNGGYILLYTFFFIALFSVLIVVPKFFEEVEDVFRIIFGIIYLFFSIASLTFAFNFLSMFLFKIKLGGEKYLFLVTFLLFGYTAYKKLKNNHDNNYD